MPEEVGPGFRFAAQAKPPAASFFPAKPRREFPLSRPENGRRYAESSDALHCLLASRTKPLARGGPRSARAFSHLAESLRARSAREAERPTLGAQRADRSGEPACRFTSGMSVREADARFLIPIRSYDRSRIAPMGKRASAVPRLEKRLSPPSRRTFRFSLLRTHDPLRHLTGAGCALPLRSAGCGGTSYGT